jgi:hypothetical protein
MTRTDLALFLMAVEALGCWPHSDRKPASETADAHPVPAMSVNICAGLASDACGLKGARLSEDPKTEAEGLPFLRAACARGDAEGCHSLATTLADSLDPRVHDGKMAIEA